MNESHRKHRANPLLHPRRNVKAKPVRVAGPWGFGGNSHDRRKQARALAKEAMQCTETKTCSRD